MKFRRFISFLVLAATLLSLLSGCGASKEPEGPIINEDGTISMRIMAPSWDVTVPRSEQWLWQAYEDKTNIRVEWEEVSRVAMGEKKSLIMATPEELPDAFYQYEAFSPEEVALYGSQGIFISLDDKLDKLPNLKKLLDENPEIRTAITAYDGHIYAFPYITTNKAELTCRYYINKWYLDELGMDVPETLDEFEAYMRGVKNLTSLDGSEIYPFYDSPHTWHFTEMQLCGSYGLANNGYQQFQMMVYNPGDDQLKFMYTDPKMKELWQRVAGWYEEGLIHPGTFVVDYDYSKWVADGMAGCVGGFTWSSASFLYSGAEKDYIGINSLEGPYGRVTSWADTPCRSTVAGMITNQCRDVDSMLAWFDGWYGEEGQIFGYAGEEGVTYNVTDGVYSYSDDITSYEGGIQLGAFQKGLLTYGGAFPFNEPDVDMKMSLFGTSFEGFYGCTEEDIEAYYPEEVWPAFVATPEEIEILNTCYNDIYTYVNESRIKFLTGEWNFEEDWDAYVDTLNSINVDEYVALKQTQFDRYRASQA